MPYPFRFNTDRDGLAKVLGELELQIMEVLWRKDCATVRDVYERLKQSREVAYTTVMTVMSRLFEKGLLARDKVGNAYSYRATSSRDEFAQSAVRRIVTLEILCMFGRPQPSPSCIVPAPHPSHH